MIVRPNRGHDYDPFPDYWQDFDYPEYDDRDDSYENQGDYEMAGPDFKFPEGSNYETQYPKFSDYLKNQVPNLHNNQKIVDALCQFGSLTSDQVKYHLQFGQGPTIKVTDLDNYGGVPGRYFGVFNSSNPNEILIDKSFVERFEGAEGFQSETLMFLVGASILHEYTHFGDFNFNENGYSFPLEEGNLFETAVYGRVINNEREAETYILEIRGKK